MWLVFVVPVCERAEEGVSSWSAGDGAGRDGCFHLVSVRIAATAGACVWLPSSTVVVAVSRSCSGNGVLDARKRVEGVEGLGRGVCMEMAKDDAVPELAVMPDEVDGSAWRSPVVYRGG